MQASNKGGVKFAALQIEKMRSTLRHQEAQETVPVKFRRCRFRVSCKGNLPPAWQVSDQDQERASDVAVVHFPESIITLILKFKLLSFHVDDLVS